MKEVAKLYIGVHDFTNFVSGERDNNDCIIYDIEFNMNNDILEIRFIGKSFYRYMVRNLVGALIEVGKNKIDKNVIKDMLDNYDLEKRLPTASPTGLYLKKINYK